MRPTINQTEKLDVEKLHLWRRDDVAHTYRS
jgi:hypothetical protein